MKRYSLCSATSSVCSLNHILFSSVLVNTVCVYWLTCHIRFLISFSSWQQFTVKDLLMTGTKYPGKWCSNLFLPHSDTPAIPVWHMRKKYTLLDPLLSILLSGRANYRDPTCCGSIFYSSEEVSGLTKYNHSQIRTMQMSNCLFPFKLITLVALHNVLCWPKKRRSILRIVRSTLEMRADCDRHLCHDEDELCQVYGWVEACMRVKCWEGASTGVQDRL